MGFRYINAAVNWMPFAGMGIYIKYKHTTGNSITVKRFDPKVIHLDCPDRQIWLVKDQHHQMSEVPWGESFDEYVNLNLWDPGVARAFGSSMFMTNFIYTEKSKCPNNRTKGRRPDDPMVVTDSGGYQMIMQKVNYIDPLALVDHYNRNTDIGIVLDIPTLNEGDDKTLKRTGRVQARNTELMMQNKRDSLELMNVFHGSALEQRIMWRDLVERPDIDRVCIGGMVDATLTTGIDILANLALTGQKYQQYHVLGVYAPAMMVCLARFGNMPGFNRLISSDSSTAIQSANHKMYHIQQEQFGPMRRLMVGDKNNVPSVHNHLTCQCPVCVSIKYTDVLAVLDSATIRWMLWLHNVYEIQRFSMMLDSVARTMSDKEYRHLATNILANGKDKIKDSMKCLDYIAAIEKDGLKKARSMFRANIVSRGIWDAAEPKQRLFEDYAVEVEEEAEIEADTKGVSENTEDWIDHKVYLERTLKFYEEGMSEVPQKKKKKEKGRNRQQGSKRFNRAIKRGMQANAVKKKRPKTSKALAKA